MRMLIVLSAITFFAGFAQAASSLTCGALFASFAPNFVVHGALLNPVLRIPDTRERGVFSNRALVTVKTRNGGETQNSQSFEVIKDRRYDAFSGFLLSPRDLHEVRFERELASGLKTIHDSYGDFLSPPDLRLVKALDRDSLDKVANGSSLGFVLVTRPNDLSKKIFGLLRVFDGTKTFDTSGIFENPLPVEEILKDKGEHSNVFDDLRNQFDSVLEIGKYFVAPDLEAMETRTVRAEILGWLRDHYLNLPTQQLQRTAFVIYVASEVHERTYRMLFGARSLDRSLFEPRLPVTDAVMIVDGVTLKSKLDAILK